MDIPRKPGFPRVPLESSGDTLTRLWAFSKERQRANHNWAVTPQISKVPLTVRDRPNVSACAPFLEALECEHEAILISILEAHPEQMEDPDVRALLAEATRRVGDLEFASHTAEQALRARRDAITLFVAGWVRGSSDPQAGLELLHEGLHGAETSSDAEWCVQFASAISTLLVRLGRYAAASDWALWAQRSIELVRPNLRWRTLRAWIVAQSLGGIVDGMAKALEELDGCADAPPRLANACALTCMDAWRARGEAARALEAGMRAWNANRDRTRIGSIARRLVHGLLEAGRAPEALEVARQALELVNGLPQVMRHQARLAEGMAHVQYDPERASTVLEEVLTASVRTMHAPTLAQAGLYLARVRLALGDAGGARTALEVARPGLMQLSAAGRRLLAGPNGWDEVFALLEGREPTVRPAGARIELRFLGTSEMRTDGQALPLRRRFAEILAVLLMHPQGLSGEQLALAVYGEDGTLECLKTELSRLRALVPIQTRPYRLGVSVRADFLDFEQLLSRGELESAFALHKGPLLPDSDAPEIARTREHLEETLRRAAIRSRDANLILKLAEHDNDDLSLWQAALRALGRADPRRALADARVAQLRKIWAV